MDHPDPGRHAPRVNARTAGFTVAPAVGIFAEPRGHVIARSGSRHGVLVNAAAANAFRGLAPGGVLSGYVPMPTNAAASRLLDLLASRGLAQRVMSLVEPFPRVQVVVPTFGRMGTVGACLDALRRLDYPGELIDLVVVDDGHPQQMAALSQAVRVGARLVRMTTNRGPAAARNRGAGVGAAPVIAFVDSDCEVPPQWLSALLPELSDPGVSAVAARVVGLPDGSALARYEIAGSPLDMGPIAHDLDRLDGRLFVPTANMIVTRDAFERVGGFDEALRVGEDVDLCLRILRAGGRIRYVPATTVTHASRRSLAGFVRQRVAYAASEAVLVGRYPALARVVHLPLVPMAAMIALAGRPRRAPWRWRVVGATGLLAAQAGAWRRLSRQTRPVPPDGGPNWIGSLASTAAANAALADGLVRHAARCLLLPLSVLASRLRRDRFFGSAFLLLAAAALSDYIRLRPPLDPPRFALLHAVDDAAYNAGLLLGAFRVRSIRAYVGGVRVTTGLPRRRPAVLRPDEGSIALPSDPRSRRPGL